MEMGIDDEGAPVNPLSWDAGDVEAAWEGDALVLDTVAAVLAVVRSTAVEIERDPDDRPRTRLLVEGPSDRMLAAFAVHWGVVRELPDAADGRSRWCLTLPFATNDEADKWRRESLVRDVALNLELAFGDADGRYSCVY